LRRPTRCDEDRLLRAMLGGGLSITPTAKAIEARLAKACGDDGCGSGG
jgi:hypothetical protein